MKRIILLSLILVLALNHLLKSQTLSGEFENGIQIGNADDNSPVGSIRYNDNTNDFEGFDGTAWMSLTFSAAQWGLSNNLVNENFKIDQPNGSSTYAGKLDLSSQYLITAGSTIAIYEMTNLGWDLDTLINPNIVGFGSVVAINDSFAVASKADSLYVYKRDPLSWVKHQSIYSNLSSIAALDLQEQQLIVGGSNDAAIFSLNGLMWVFDETIIPGDLSSGDSYGSSVAIWDTVAVVGAFLQNGFKGSAYVYHHRNGSWINVDKLLPQPLDAQFGVSVEVDAQCVYVGVRYADRQPSLSRGSVEIFEYSSGNYLKTDEIVPTTEFRSDNFSFAMDLYENDLIIGANGVENGSQFGAAFFYRKLGANWILQSQFIQTDPLNQDRFADHLAIYGDWAVVGAHNVDKIYFISK